MQTIKFTAIIFLTALLVAGCSEKKEEDKYGPGPDRIIFSHYEVNFDYIEGTFIVTSDETD
ncbi:MAG: hypothetical protein LUF90_07630 [Rikenellaceae bacterium]|nr:hypothetical protein [Rikenellaceae bacterium]